MTRLDGRTANQLRPPYLEFAAIPNAHGSAIFGSAAFRAPRVACAIYGPGATPKLRKEIPGRLRIEVCYRTRAQQRPNAEDRILELKVRKFLEQIIVTESKEYDRQTLRVALHPVTAEQTLNNSSSGGMDDASRMIAGGGSNSLLSSNVSYVATLFNATVVALLNAGVYMRSTPMTVGLARIPNNIETNINSGNKQDVVSGGDESNRRTMMQLVLDPTLKELVAMQSNQNHTGIAQSSGKEISRQNQTAKLFSLDQNGCVIWSDRQNGGDIDSMQDEDEEHESEELELATQATKVLFTFLRKSLSQYANHPT